MKSVAVFIPLRGLRGLGAVSVGGGQLFEVHGAADHVRLGGSGAAAAMVVQTGGDFSLLRIEIHSGAVTFSGSVSVTDCALMSTQLVGNLASASFGASLTDSTVSLSGGSAVLDGSCTCQCTLVNSAGAIFMSNMGRPNYIPGARVISGTTFTANIGSGGHPDAASAIYWVNHRPSQYTNEAANVAFGGAAGRRRLATRNESASLPINGL
eukprot:COSAG06_NODE_6440_length_2933_cov_1.390967_2_plen_210_part_00